MGCSIIGPCRAFCRSYSYNRHPFSRYFAVQALGHLYSYNGTLLPVSCFCMINSSIFNSRRHAPHSIFPTQNWKRGLKCLLSHVHAYLRPFPSEPEGSLSVDFSLHAPVLRVLSIYTTIHEPPNRTYFPGSMAPHSDGTGRSTGNKVVAQAL